MRRQQHQLFVAALALVLVGCSHELSVAPPPPSVLAGTWVHIREANQPPGNFMQWNLSVTDTVVTGAGTSAGEAGPSGPVSIRGYYSKGVVHLDLDLMIELPSRNLPGFHRVFEGTLLSSTELVGTNTNDDQTSGTEHMRKNTAEP